MSLQKKGGQGLAPALHSLCASQVQRVSPLHAAAQGLTSSVSAARVACSMLGPLRPTKPCTAWSAMAALYSPKPGCLNMCELPSHLLQAYDHGLDQQEEEEEPEFSDDEQVGWRCCCLPC